MKEYLTTALQKWNISLEEKQIEALLSYVSLLLEYNRHTNLTAIREEKAVLEKHILDSLLLQEFIPKEAKTAIDIGTGAGFPGMVLAICNPHLQFTLMDSVGKNKIFRSSKGTSSTGECRSGECQSGGLHSNLKTKRVLRFGILSRSF